MVRNILLFCFLFLFTFVQCDCGFFATKDGEAETIAGPVKDPVDSVDQDPQIDSTETNDAPAVSKKQRWQERIRPGKRTDVTWDDLYEFDYKKGVATPFLKAIEGKPVRLPGFVIPLTDGDVASLSEFLIVPEPMMCIHVPPPPPNLLLYGTASPPISVQSLWEPVWLSGEIRVEKKESSYAVAGFTMVVTKVAPYEEEIQ